METAVAGGGGEGAERERVRIRGFLCCMWKISATKEKCFLHKRFSALMLFFVLLFCCFCFAVYYCCLVLFREMLSTIFIAAGAAQK